MKTRKQTPVQKAEDGNRSKANVTKTDEPTSTTTKAAVAAGVAVVILQPELLPVVAIGAGVALSPKLVPAAGRVFRSAAKAVIRTGFRVAHATQEIVAEAGEEVRDLVAESRPEHAPSRA